MNHQYKSVSGTFTTENRVFKFFTVRVINNHFHFDDSISTNIMKWTLNNVQEFLKILTLEKLQFIVIYANRTMGARVKST